MLQTHRAASLRLARSSASSPTVLRSSVFSRHVSRSASSALLSRSVLKIPRTWTRSLLLAGIAGTSFFAYANTTRPVLADAEEHEEAKTESSRPKGPLTSLMRTYIVYSLCSIPMLVDYSPAILSVLMAVPGVKQLTETFVRYTFFAQFVGAETAVGLMPILTQLREEGKGALISYSVEVNAAEAAGKKTSHTESSPHKQLIEEYIRSVDVAADFEDRISGRTGKRGMGRRTWVPLKLTALLPDSESLRRFSIHLLKSRPLPPSKILVPFPGCPRPSDFDLIDRDSFDPINLPESSPLTVEDVSALKELKADLFRICERARERGVRILIDAEHSWYQPAIDALQLALMREFNRLPEPRRSSWSNLLTNQSAPAHDEVSVQPLVYGTFQAYLRRTPGHLQQSLLDAQAGNYALGVKLVRGAYHLFEKTAHAQRVNQPSQSDRKAASSPSIQTIESDEGGVKESKPPVWDIKEETDRCYDECAEVLLGWVADDMGRREERARVGVIFGTHNSESVRRVFDLLVKKGLATSLSASGPGNQAEPIVNIPDATAERVTFGQLFGMRDALTEYIVSRTQSTYPCVVKCLPYGALSEVLPYLVRRAIENKSVLNQGSAAEERQRVGREIMRRVRSAVGF